MVKHWRELSSRQASKEMKEIFPGNVCLLYLCGILRAGWVTTMGVTQVAPAFVREMGRMTAQIPSVLIFSGFCVVEEHRACVNCDFLELSRLQIWL